MTLRSSYVVLVALSVVVLSLVTVYFQKQHLTLRYIEMEQMERHQAHHGDHVGGNEVFRHFAIIIGHDNVRTRMLASPAETLRDFPARVEAARKAGNEAQVKQLSEQIDWAKSVEVEEIPAPVLTFDSELRIHVALDRVIGKVPASVTIIPGHGEVTDVAGLKAFRQYIADVLDVARKAKAAGTSKDDFLKQVDIAAYKDYSGYADRFKSNAAAAWDEAP